MDDDRRLTLPKYERIFWKRHLDLLFSEGQSFVAYPLRVIYLPVEKVQIHATASIIISVSKKKFKHAVDRNAIKRRVRESYRLQKHELIDCFAKKESALLVAFLYLSKEKSSFETIDKAISKAVQLLIQKYE